MTGDGDVGLRRCGVFEDVGIAVRLDQHIDQLDGKSVVELRGQAVGAGQVRVHLDQQDPVGVSPGPAQLVSRRSQVQRQVDPAVGVGRCCLGRHDPGGEGGEDGGELAEASPGTSSMLWPSANKMRSAGPKNPERYETPGLVSTV